MIEKLELLKGAEEDIFAAYTKLLDSGNGEEFYRRVDEKLDLIRAFPRIGNRYLGEHRRVLELKYSYGIYYRIYHRRIFVSAILPLRIDPEEIRQRLE